MGNSFKTLWQLRKHKACIFRTPQRASPSPPRRTSKPGSDGYLGDKNSPDGGKGGAPINDAAKPNTYTSNKGSKRQ